MTPWKWSRLSLIVVGKMIIPIKRNDAKKKGKGKNIAEKKESI